MFNMEQRGFEKAPGAEDWGKLCLVYSNISAPLPGGEIKSLLNKLLLHFLTKASDTCNVPHSEPANTEMQRMWSVHLLKQK